MTYNVLSGTLSLYTTTTMTLCERVHVSYMCSLPKFLRTYVILPDVVLLQINSFCERVLVLSTADEHYG